MKPRVLWRQMVKKEESYPGGRCASVGLVFNEHPLFVCLCVCVCVCVCMGGRVKVAGDWW